MRITAVEDLHADGGWRTYSFVKISTDEGLTGWSEYSEMAWAPGLTGVVRALAPTLIGRDPRHYARLGAEMRARTRPVTGGLADQAIAALENGCLDLAGKAAGVPVHALFGGPLRDRVPLYWSHCGMFRVTQPELFEKVVGTPPLRTLDDIVALGKEAVARGWKALKTNPILFGPNGPHLLNPGFGTGIELGRNGSAAVFDAIHDQIAAFRQGAGPHMGLLLDVNFGFAAESLRQLAYRLEPLDMFWLEADMHVPETLAQVRQAVRTPIASLEAVYGVRGYRPFIEAGAVDVAIIDVVWNGFLESQKIAAIAEARDVNVAPHNFYGHLASMMSAQFCAAVPNVRVMEYDADDVPWREELFTYTVEIVDGTLIVPNRPGWGTDVNEEVLRAHPVKRLHQQP